MSDAHLTDHEWRLKMAAEGKAIYIPGKTADELREERERPDRETVTVTLTLRLGQALETVLSELTYLIGNVEQALSAMESGLNGGTMDGLGAAPMLSLFARSLKSFETDEGKTLHEFENLLRDSLSVHLEASRRTALAKGGA